MKALKASSTTAVPPANARGAGLKLLRSVAIYSAITVAVSAGGVLVGAIVVAPAVSHATPYFSGTAQHTESNGSIGQADGDGAALANAANQSVPEQFKPLPNRLLRQRNLKHLKQLRRFAAR